MDDEIFEYEPESLGNRYSVADICLLVLDGLERDFGDEIPFQMLLAVERRMHWQTEIVAMKSETEDVLLEKHHSFDAHIWEKALDTKAWGKFRLKVESLSRRYLDLAIDEVVQRELQGNCPPGDPLL